MDSDIEVDIDDNQPLLATETTPPAMGKGPPEPFTTIDWIRDINRDRHRRIGQQTHKKQSLKGYCWYLFEASQAWILVLLIGVATGIAASLIDMGVEWMSDMKVGVCLPEIWLSNAMCCRGLDPCDNWRDWSDFLTTFPLTARYALSWFIYVVVAVAFATACAWLVKVYAPMAAGSGIPEVKTILGGFVITKYLGGWTLLIKSAGLVLAVSSGMNLGKEGPLVHVACCIGNVMTRLFEKFHFNEVKKREALSAAAAAGVSVAFGAPIGGVLFSLEEVSSYFPSKTLWRSFFCAVAAALMLQVINPFHTGKLVLFQVNFHNNWNWFELLPFVFLGCCGGVLGGLFTKLNTKICNLRRDTFVKNYPISEVMVVAGVTALASYASLFLRTDTSVLISQLFDECIAVGSLEDTLGLCSSDLAAHTIVMLLVAAAVKMTLTIFTFGLRIPCGLFIPSLAVGACVGRAVGVGMSMMQAAHRDWGFFNECNATTQCITPGIYALIGAAAMLGGVTRMTVSLVVIMFELTGGINMIIPLILSTMFAKWVADAVNKSSVYDEHIRMNGYPFLELSDDAHITAEARDVMTSQEMVTIPLQGNTVKSLETLLNTYAYRGFPLVSSMTDNIVVGMVLRRELLQILKEKRDSDQVDDDTRCYFSNEQPFGRSGAFVDLRNCVDETPITVVESTSLSQIAYLFKSLGLRYCVVIRQAKLVGLISKKDILRYMRGFHQSLQERHMNHVSDDGL
eukprot:TRINITY_DN681_c0_g1_i3.p1 TRINITY_DN681_c0_g1~~TRINITY_DN681_c0_g1_i3.p1  ORF type:complete len:738 (+),score=141.68 TRINITY_DN681_c0_g1_i3:35-2248(+)